MLPWQCSRESPFHGGSVAPRMVELIAPHGMGERWSGMAVARHAGPHGPSEMVSDGLEGVRRVCLVVCPYRETDANTLHARPVVTDVPGKPQPVHSSTPDRPKSGEQGFSAHDLCACLLLRQAE